MGTGGKEVGQHIHQFCTTAGRRTSARRQQSDGGTRPPDGGRHHQPGLRRAISEAFSRSRSANPETLKFSRPDQSRDQHVGLNLNPGLSRQNISARSRGQNYFDLHFNLDVNISVPVGLSWSESDSSVSARTRYRSGELAVSPVVGLV